MKHLLRTVLFLFIVGFLSSCNKDDEAPVTKSQLLSEKRWITTAISINPPVQLQENQPPTNDFFSALDPCRKDNILYFNINNTYTHEEGASNCFSGASQVLEAGTWLLNSDETVLVTIGELFINEPFPLIIEDLIAESNTSYDILEITPTNLTLRYIWNFRDEETGALAATYAFTQNLVVVND